MNFSLQTVVAAAEKSRQSEKYFTGDIFLFGDFVDN
jgi:hypothetical protein